MSFLYLQSIGQVRGRYPVASQQYEAYPKKMMIRLELCDNPG